MTLPGVKDSQSLSSPKNLGPQSRVANGVSSWSRVTEEESLPSLSESSDNEFFDS
jgi:hypothetical protein